MWKHYRKTFVPIQVAILAVCAALYFVVKASPQAALTFFVVMQVGSLYGASMGVRWRSRITREVEQSPLERRAGVR